VDGIMSSKLFATRQGTIFLGVIAAVIAAVALIVYLNHYRNSVNNGALSTVLVAKQPIQKGTPGDVMISSAGTYYQVSHLAKSSIPAGALTDPSALAGKVVATDIGQGQKLTAADFGPATNSLTERLSPNQRAVVIPLGSAQQVGGQIGSGSHVDVWISTTTGTNGSGSSTVQLLFQDLYVLGVNGGNVTLRTTPQQAGQIIFASSHSTVWFDLRPTVAKNTRVRPVTNLKAGG
jgi:Flp pilus assembly protein CpaB